MQFVATRFVLVSTSRHYFTFILPHYSLGFDVWDCIHERLYFFPYAMLRTRYFIFCSTCAFAITTSIVERDFGQSFCWTS